MEMLRKKKDNSEYEIDRELTWKFAIEKNAEYQEKIEQLEEENKKLTKCNLNLQEWLDNKEKVNKSLREELSKLKEKYWDIDY
jgi:small-conductance mechanosensitive channel